MTCIPGGSITRWQVLPHKSPEPLEIQNRKVPGPQNPRGPGSLDPRISPDRETTPGPQSPGPQSPRTTQNSGRIPGSQELRIPGSQGSQELRTPPNPGPPELQDPGPPGPQNLEPRPADPEPQFALTRERGLEKPENENVVFPC